MKKQLLIILLLVSTLLAAKPNSVYSLKRKEAVYYTSKGDEPTSLKIRDLMATTREEVKVTKNRLEPEKKESDPYKASKRRVKRGPDPIHNKA
ncbi:hypothetical protein V2J09_003771 [Rumex salicifolius]